MRFRFSSEPLTKSSLFLDAPALNCSMSKIFTNASLVLVLHFDAAYIKCGWVGDEAMWVGSTLQGTPLTKCHNKFLETLVFSVLLEEKGPAMEDWLPVECLMGKQGVVGSQYLNDVDGSFGLLV